MIERLPYLAAGFLGAALAAIPSSQGISFLTTAAAGIIGAVLTMLIYGAYFAGKSAALKQINGGAHG